MCRFFFCVKSFFLVLQICLLVYSINFYNFYTTPVKVLADQAQKILINEFVGNPDCLTPDNLEWVELFNPSTSETVDLTGWVLRDNTKSASNRKTLTKNNTTIYDANGKVLVDTLTVPPLGYAVFKTPEGWLNNQNTGQEGVFLYRSSKDAKDDVNLVDKITFGTPDSDIVDYPLADQVIARVPNGASPTLKTKTKYQNYNTLGRSNDSDPNPPRACGNDQPPTDPSSVEIEIDFNYLSPKQAGKVCGLGAALDNDGLKITIKNWQNGYQIEKRQALVDQNLGEWENITNLAGSSLQIYNSTATYFYPNTQNTPAGTYKFQIRVLDSKQTVLSQTKESVYEVLTDINNPVCIQEQIDPKIEDLKIGFLTKEIFNNQAYPEIMGTESLYGSYCGSTTKDRSVDLPNQNKASWVQSRWTKIPGANSYQVTDYQILNGNLVLIKQYNPKESALNDVNINYLEKDSYIEFTSYWQDEGVYFRQVEAMDKDGQVLAKNSFQNNECFLKVQKADDLYRQINLKIKDPLDCRGYLLGQVLGENVQLKQVDLKISSNNQLILEKVLSIDDNQKNFEYSLDVSSYLKPEQIYDLKVVASAVYTDIQGQLQELTDVYEDKLIYRTCKNLNTGYKTTLAQKDLEQNFLHQEQELKETKVDIENFIKEQNLVKEENYIKKPVKRVFSDKNINLEETPNFQVNPSQDLDADSLPQNSKILNNSLKKDAKENLVRTGAKEEQRINLISFLLVFFGFSLLVSYFEFKKKPVSILN